MLTRVWFYLTQGTVAQHSLRGPYALGFLAFTTGSAYAKTPFLHERQATSMKHVSKEQVADSNEPESTSSSNVHGMEATTMSNWATLIDGAPVAGSHPLCKRLSKVSKFAKELREGWAVKRKTRQERRALGEKLLWQGCSVLQGGAMSFKKGMNCFYDALTLSPLQF